MPSSKSITNRLVNLAWLSDGETRIRHPLQSDDIRAFLDGLVAAGFRVESDGDEVRIHPHERPQSARIDCGNSGTMLRFVVASLATLPGEWTVDGSTRLRQRPVGELIRVLRDLGAEIECLAEEGFAPLRIMGDSVRGGKATLDARESSQYLSALLMAAPRFPDSLEIRVEGLVSGPYVELTLEVLALAGVEFERMDYSLFRVLPRAFTGGSFTVESDFSSASYWAAGAALTGGTVTLTGLKEQSRQGDRYFLDLIAEIGAELAWTEAGVTVRGGGPLRAVDVDLSNMPDMVPTLAALAPFAEGTTRIRNVPHLRLKESDRLAAMTEELRRVGAEVEELSDGLVIPGNWAHGRPPGGATLVNPHGDHRIAMSMALVGLRRPGLAIQTSEVVSKSYPEFWTHLEMLAG